MRAARTAVPGHRVLLALLLSAALLVCHGLFGASHVLAHGGEPVRDQVVAVAKGDDTSLASRASAGCCAEGIPSAQHAGHGAGEPTPYGALQPSGQAGGMDYFAVLLVLAGALLLAAFRGARARAGAASARTSSARPRFAPSPLPRGPSPPLLQVFRL